MWPFTSAKKKNDEPKPIVNAKYNGSCSGCGLRANGDTFDEFADNCERVGLAAFANNGKPIGYICNTCSEFLRIGGKCDD